MPVTPTDELALALDHLRHSVAASASFQDWTGTVDEDSALARVHLGEAASDATVPFAVVWLKSSGAVMTAAGQGDEYENSDALMLQLVADTSGADRESEYITILNRVGGLRRDVLERSGTGSPYLSVASLTVMRVFRHEPQNAAARGRDQWIAFIEVLVRP